MSLVADHNARERGDAVCRVLTLRGYRLHKFYASGDQLIFVLTILPDESAPWRKAFQIAEDDATGDAVEALVKAWKEKVRGDLFFQRPSQVVRDAIAHFGTLAVQMAVRA